MKTEETAGVITNGIKDYFKNHNFSKAVIGLSGGIDSSTTAFLAVQALGNGNVTGILMPEDGLTSGENVNDALEVANILKIKHYKIPINNFINHFHLIGKDIFNNKNSDGNNIDNNTDNAKNNETAIANSKARIRMSILYHFANAHNALVVGTSNKSEIMLGYATKYGDAASDIIPLGDLWKTQVRELAAHLGIPQKIISKAPTAELVSGITDEGELGADYEVLDRILRLHFEDEKTHNEVILNGFDRELVKNVFERIRVNEHKRKMPHTIRLSAHSGINN
ncbi:NAD+ synthase [Candidatus Woesearchaeota archaeon]|nr:NAD+ synthase [Candidatus Woesearchaeota archaeon]